MSPVPTVLRRGVLCLALALPGLVQAQELPAVLAAREALQRQASARLLAPSDVADLAAQDVVPDRRSGATVVVMVQRHAGVPVVGTETPVAVDAAGRVLAPARPPFQADLARRAGPATPTLSPDAALAAAAAHVRGLALGGTRADVYTDDPAADAALALPPARPGSYDALRSRLVWQPHEGALRLAWAVEMSGGAELWEARIDARTGEVLAALDLVVHEHDPRAEAERHAAHDHAHATRVPLAAAPAPPALAGLGGAANSSYRVVPMPFESPNHGPFALVVNPADATASPLGWHNTGANQYTITRGNNAWAYEDRNGTNSPSTPASSPDGGPGLVFDVPFDAALAPAANVDAAVVNLFYWGNVFHDVFYRYGFDEPAGNFQTNNFGRGGAGNDPVRLEALDGSAATPPTFNNANFSTPSDGSSGRMQMFEWTSVPVVEITAPAPIAGVYGSRGAVYGPQRTVSGEIVPVYGPAGQELGCTAAEYGTTNVTGKIALVARGTCPFVQKTRTAQARGAIGLIVHNCDPAETASCTGANPGEALISMGIAAGDTGSDVTIPSALVRLSTGQLIKDAAPPVAVSMVFAPNRDSDFDAGIIAHEYGHGLSNRLIGGPSTASCMSNVEQMGEGWSDYAGLALTMRAGDTPAQRRGIGTYVVFEPTDGEGIRPAPYSTDFAVNDYTYQDVISFGGQGGPRGLAAPHGVGFVWASALWDMTWNLVAERGFSTDFYNAEGMAGNQVALNLVTTGLKLTPCGPGFVSGRDAILRADTLLYNGANSPAIWRAFARRGLGAGASQGSASVLNDGVASFALPVTVSEATAPTASAARLSLAGPNPARSRTAVRLSSVLGGPARVELFDALGRHVAVLHDGEHAPGASLDIGIDASRLPAGVYTVRARAEGAEQAVRLTILR